MGLIMYSTKTSFRGLYVKLKCMPVEEVVPGGHNKKVNAPYKPYSNPSYPPLLTKSSKYDIDTYIHAYIHPCIHTYIHKYVFR